jgi:hypothetical protein
LDLVNGAMLVRVVVGSNDCDSDSPHGSNYGCVRSVWVHLAETVAAFTNPHPDPLKLFDKAPTVSQLYALFSLSKYMPWRSAAFQCLRFGSLGDVDSASWTLHLTSCGGVSLHMLHRISVSVYSHFSSVAVSGQCWRNRCSLRTS